MKDLTEEKWAVGAALVHVDKPLQRATQREKKDVLLAFLEQLVAAAVEQNKV